MPLDDGRTRSVGAVEYGEKEQKKKADSKRDKNKAPEGSKTDQAGKEGTQADPKEKTQTITNIINNNNINNFIINDPSAVADLMQTAAGDSHFHSKNEGNKQPTTQGERQAKKKPEGEYIQTEDKQREHIEQIQNHQRHSGPRRLNSNVRGVRGAQ